MMVVRVVSTCTWKSNKRVMTIGQGLGGEKGRGAGSERELINGRGQPDEAIAKRVFKDKV